ncbi:type II secretion system F family protein [Brevibacillus sp. GCM10020057]|uniref:type II secretion system F family protein n=1 Tax=Brevibacillus sp. GCM10020057 TaxID=3317327 RepID=UPI0036303EB6
MGLLCALIGLALFLYGFPACLGSGDGIILSLFSRIEQEQQAQLEHSFQQSQSRWTLVRYLEKHDDVLERLCGWLGIDRKKTEETLQRLRLKVSLPEIVLVRAIGLILMASSLMHLAASVYVQHSLHTANGLPLLASLILFLLPAWILDGLDKRAKGEIREQVPVFFSIVLALVEAGMPLQSAVKETAQRFDARLGHEMARLEMEERRLGTWRKALEELAFRWEVDALTTIALEMNEAVNKGVSIAGMLAVQVEEQVRQLEDEAATRMNRLNIRLLPFVIVLMGVPLLFLVMGPAFIGIEERL